MGVNLRKILLTAAALGLGMIALRLFSNDLLVPLPIWIDNVREKPDGYPPIHRSRTPPPSDFRIPAEYEPIDAVVLSWRGYTSTLNQISRLASEYGKAEVWVAEGPESISNVPDMLYSNINCPVNTIWIRDFGPFGISQKTGQHGIIDTTYRHYQYRRDDDAMPFCLGQKKDIPSYSVDLIMDGGNFMVDSKGNLFMTKRTYQWNSNKTPEYVDSLLKKYFNVKYIHALDYAGYPNYPRDGTGHIDMFVKLLNDYTVLISNPLNPMLKKQFHILKS